MIFEKDWEKNLNKIDKALTKESHKLIAQMFYNIAKNNCAEIVKRHKDSPAIIYWNEACDSIKNEILSREA